MAEGKECYIRVRGTLVAVTPDVYHVCHQTKRQAKTLYEKDERNNLVSYDGMDTEDTLGEETIPDLSTPSVEDIVLDRLHKEKLRLCLPMLTKEEWSLVYALYYEEKTEREYAGTLGISQNAVNKRRHKVLAKLRYLMKI